MALVVTDEQHYGDIASAIRLKLNVETTYLPSEMAAAIGEISGSSTLGTKSITQNGTYTASDDSLDGYSEVTVAVENSYSASDEGMVVSGGALVEQTSTTVTENGTYDTTTNSEVVVNVSGSENAIQIVEPYVFDMTRGYVSPVGGNGFTYSPSSDYRCDVYKVTSGHYYVAMLGTTVSNRNRVMFSTTDTSTATSNVSGTVISASDNVSTHALMYCTSAYRPSSNGYITIAKSTQGVAGITSYLLDVTDL